MRRIYNLLICALFAGCAATGGGAPRTQCPPDRPRPTGRRRALRHLFALGPFVLIALTAACGGSGKLVSQPLVPSNVESESRGTLTLGTPSPKVSPTSLNFGYVTIDTTSSPKPVVFSNEGAAPLNIAKIAATCTSAFCFAQTNTCGQTVAAGGKCILSVAFTPHQAGSATGTLSVYDNAAGSPQTVSLSGVGQTACLPYGAPCSPLYSRCCPGLKCIFHGGSIRVGYSCGTGSAASEEYLEKAVARNGWSLYAAGLPDPSPISVIATKTQTLLGKIAINGAGSSIAILPNGKKLYVSQPDDNSVVVVDTGRNAVVRVISVGFSGPPTDVSVAKDGLTAYAVSAQLQTISVIDTTTDTVTGIRHGSTPPANVELVTRCAPGVVASPDGHVAFVLNAPHGVEAPTTILDNQLALALGAGG